MSTTVSPGYTKTPKKQDSFKIISQDAGRGFSRRTLLTPLKEIQENTAKQVEVLKEETQKSLKEL